MRRRILRWVAASTTLVLLLGLGLAANLVWFRPFSLDLFFDKLLVEQMLASPETTTALGIAAHYGWRRHEAHLDDLSLAKEQRDMARVRRNLATLQAYDPAHQSSAQQLSTRILLWDLQAQVDGQKFHHHDYPVQQVNGAHNQLLDFLINVHQIDDRRGAEDFLARLDEVPRKFDQLLEQLRAREQEGIVPPRFVIERVLTQLRAFEGVYVRDNPLYVHFAQRLPVILTGRETDVLALLNECASLIQTRVRPAYRKLIVFFDGQLQRAGTDDGVWQLPDGDAYYAWRLRMETTTNLTAQQVHELGVAEVARIEDQMRAILTVQKELRKAETPAQAIGRLAREPRFLYPNDDAGREAALTQYRSMLAEQLQLSRRVIGKTPRVGLEVQRVPAYREQGSPAAYYLLPSLDGKRPGIFFANLRDMNELPKFTLRTLSVHEGIPGHHLQIALAREAQGVPTVRKTLNFNAYAEGWALYAEWLATELGVYQDDPWGDLGRLQAEMHRAVRLIVDTGIHYKRWPRQQAIDYLREKTGMPLAAAVSEVERYIVMPGQACSYKIGMLGIQAARRRAELALADRWHPEAEKAFHDKVLAIGSVPLEILDQQVDAWVKTRLAR